MTAEKIADAHNLLKRGIGVCLRHEPGAGDGTRYEILIQPLDTVAFLGMDFIPGTERAGWVNVTVISPGGHGRMRSYQFKIGCGYLAGSYIAEKLAVDNPVSRQVVSELLSKIVGGGK